MKRDVFYTKEGTLRHQVFGLESHCIQTGSILDFFRDEAFDYRYTKDLDFLSLEEVRRLKSLQSEQGRKLFIIRFLQVQKESQNALLKMLEEPSSDSYFIFIFPHKKNLLPTLRSRMLMVQVNDQGKPQPSSIDIQEYQARSLSEKFDFHASLLKKKDYEKKDLLAFFDLLESSLKKEGDSGQAQKLSEIFYLRSLIARPQVSIKLILDYLALVLEQE